MSVIISTFVGLNLVVSYSGDRNQHALDFSFYFIFVSCSQSSSCPHKRKVSTLFSSYFTFDNISIGREPETKISVAGAELTVRRVCGVLG